MAEKDGNPATQTTESASDDDDYRPIPENSLPLSFIREKLSNSNIVEEISITKEDNLTLTTPSKLTGAYRRKGKWWSEITNPFTRRKIYLGVFNTPEEASHAFAAKKLEFQNRKETLVCIDDRRRLAKKTSNKRSRVDYETVLKDSNNKGEESSCSKEGEGDGIRNTLNKFRGIRQEKSGRWGAQIHDPFTKGVIWLGTFDTPEEASIVYEAKRLEFLNRKEGLIDAPEYSFEEAKEDHRGAETILKDNNKGEESSSSKEEEADQIRNTPNKFRGIGREKSGWWGVQIHDPFTKRLIWLGTFDTTEEASIVYEAKRLEFLNWKAGLTDAPEYSFEEAKEDHRGPETILKDNSKGEENSSSKEEAADRNRNTPNKFRGIRREKTGRWGASIQDPFMKHRIWLGTFDTPEEASNTYEAKRLEFLSRKGGLIDAPGRMESLKFVGAYPRNTGRWFSNIRDPFTRRKIHLGDFDSPEEASNAWVAKKQEFSLKLKQARSWEQTECAESSSFEGGGQKMENSSLNNNRKTSCSKKEMDHKLRGVRLRKSGKWSAKIYDQFSKREIWLGTFDTRDEASNVCAAKRLEFNQRKKGRISIDATQSVSESGISVEENDDFESSFHNDCQEREPQLLSVKRSGVVLEKVVLKKFRGMRQKKKGRWGAMINDPFTKHQSSLDTFDTPEEASKVKKLEFDERKEAQICMDLALPEYEPVKCGQQFVDRQILEQILLDSNGFLLGEFSNLDDELRIL